jgi:hypothetical protein
MTASGKSPHDLRCDGTASGSEAAKRERNGRCGSCRDETPEEAARAIADALDFLARETASLGMREVCALIQRASKMMRGFCSERRLG